MKLEKSQVLPLITSALKEDIGPRDLTASALIPHGETAEAQIVARQEGILAGLAVAEWTFAAVDPRIRFKPMVRDGERIYPEKAVVFLEGPARGVLVAERVALNFLGRLSGIATLTHAFVDEVRGTPAKIFDTRKTTPTLRFLERYAVSAGGGMNHRMGLYDQVLIKENHLRLVAKQPLKHPSVIEQAVAQVRAALRGLSPKGTLPVEVEVTTLAEFRQALAARAEIILLDNMELRDIQEAVRLRDAVVRSRKARKILLEASGGVTLQTVRALAQAGVDRISVGALTHSAPAFNLALEVIR